MSVRKHTRIWEKLELQFFLKKINTQLKVQARVKYTTPLPCIVLSESDSNLYTNFEFCEGKIITIENTLIYKAKQFVLGKNIKNSVHDLEDGGANVQVDILNM